MSYFWFPLLLGVPIEILGCLTESPILCCFAVFCPLLLWKSAKALLNFSVEIVIVIKCPKSKSNTKRFFAHFLKVYGLVFCPTVALALQMPLRQLNHWCQLMFLVFNIPFFLISMFLFCFVLISYTLMSVKVCVCVYAEISRYFVLGDVWGCFIFCFVLFCFFYI